MLQSRRFRVVGMAIVPAFLGCVPEEADLIDNITVQVPTGAGVISTPPQPAQDASEETAANNFTPYGDFNATGLQAVIPPDVFSTRDGDEGSGGNGDQGGSDDSFAPLLVSGSTLYSGMVSGSDHQVLEGGFPEVNTTSSKWLTVGFDEAQQPVGLSIPGFAGLTPFAIEVTPIDEPVQYTGTSGPPLEMDFVYEVTPRVWTVDASGFHGEFDVLVYAETNGFIVEGTMTHTVDGALQDDTVTHASTTHYDCEMKRPNEQLLFMAHQTFVFGGRLIREQ